MEDDTKLTKNEAWMAMLDGKKVRHDYYGEDEYIFINSNREIQSEDGVIHGGKQDEFWVRYQAWIYGWNIVN